MYKILAIDGGGIKGVFPAAFLASIEEDIGDKVSNYFDLIVGTSTGGIIALALGLGMSSKEILSFYEQSGPKIFKGNRFFRVLRQIGFSKYSQKPLREALCLYFKDKQLGDCQTRVVVPSLNLETGEVHVFKTAHHERFKRDYKEKVVDVALSTSAAPTFFPTQRSSVGTPLVDGGLWANNPVGTAVVEALGILNWNPGEFDVLSIGCTAEPMSIKWGRKFPLGMGYWAKKSVEAFMKAQSSQSLGTAKLLAGHSHIYRFDPSVEAKRFSLDGINEIQSLRGLGISEARKALPVIESIFFKSIAAPFEPFYKLY
ncbi:CBASS cGAMP-activated phospholipase [Cohnella sp. WQ 127256]|uniref:CBASS cGAMP-activated phospholipase n=1 Tax=Cohnella sp. WQ 127256 TaxID=2938790 RepID=UPI0021173090